MKNLLNYILVIFSIIVSGSLFFSSFNDDLILVFYFCLSLAGLALLKNPTIKKYFLTYALIASSYLILQPLLLNNLSGININFGYVLRVFSFLFVISIIGYDTFSKTYVKVLTVFCCLNLILYIDQVLLFKVIRPLPGYLSTFDGNVLYQNYIFYVKQTVSLSYENFNPGTWIKNPGIFGEGGLYQYFLNLALIINLSIKHKNIFTFSNIIFIISILTTFSTVGYIIMIGILFMVFFNNPKISYKPLKFILLLPLIFIILSSYTVASKFKIDNTAFFSTQRRVLDTIIDSNVIFDNPLFGIGLGNIKEWKNYSNEFMGGSSSSNGLTNYISKVGILGFFITLYPFFISRIRGKNKLILFCNGLTLITQGIVFAPIFLLSMSLLKIKRVQLEV